MYNLVTPKYFEIASAGSLLIGQYCDDLEYLGFDASNALIFDKSDFIEKVEDYRKRPEDYVELRRKGRKLIREKHTLSHRIATLRNVYHQ